MTPEFLLAAFFVVLVPGTGVIYTIASSLPRSSIQKYPRGELPALRGQGGPSAPKPRPPLAHPPHI